MKKRLKYLLFRLFVRHPMLADLFYVINGTFRDEHRAVIAGRLAHLRSVPESSGSGELFILRRNTHRIEKGLIHRPLRGVFATGYIHQTVSLLVRLSASPPASADPADPDPVLWSYRVVQRYFAAVGTHPEIELARSLFARMTPPHSTAADPRGEPIPFQRSTINGPPVSYEALLDLARQRRSVRWYLQEPVDRALVDRALEVARLSPSACNRQPFEFRFYDDPALIAAIGAIPDGTGGFLHNFPMLVVLTGRLRAFPTERDRHVIYIDAALAAMAFQFALESLGLASCCINWPNTPKKIRALRRVVRMDPDEQVVMLLSIGRPDPTGMVPFSAKRRLDEIRSFNRTC